MKSEIIETFEETTKKFLTTLQSFDSANINQVPFEGSWTAAQVADHVLKSQQGLPGILGGKTEPTDRKPEEKRETVQKIFLDYSTKMKSPDFILPSLQDHDREELIAHVKNTSSHILKAMQTHELDKICKGFELPNMGPFTGFEWGWFAIYHTQRHIHQMENIRSYVIN